ncbi:sensor histidine kinase [Crateriforma conspicua]|uniref:sensor histidine kinase n=1 Tax=Crateriforma conspicua TaxID=2527996 RepID=UPI00118C5B9F|nr:HAMP domain-containing sensor histidine kinase [Crateriforma conspicua]QDV65454.1 Sensor protein ZraS [Crateriforma conspicua]
MRLLPCLRIAGQRWWLPLSAGAADVLMHIMLMSGGDAPARSVGSAVDRLAEQINDDPPLMIFTALAMTASGAMSETGKTFETDRQRGNMAAQDQSWTPDAKTNEDVSRRRVTTTELACWLSSHTIDLFSDGDAFLAAPEVTPTTRARWGELQSYFATLPRHHWIDQADLWLEVFGTQVSQDWKRTWLCWDDPAEQDDMPRGQGSAPPTVTPLQRLARQRKQQLALESEFEFQLEQVKLASLKELAYGLSHEINNPLTNISTRAQQLQRDEADPQRRASLQRIVDQAYRAHEMIADLMFYANPPQPEFSVGDVTPVVQVAIGDWMDHADEQAIQIRSDLPSSLPPVKFDADMLRETLAALIQNAIEAIGRHGTVIVSTQVNGDRPNDDDPADHHRWIKIHVADSGPGLSPQARRHAFDPYFSGREAGRGLGLGLCRAYRIVQLHQGRIHLAGGAAGCVATIQLPIALPSASLNMANTSTSR